MFERGALHFHPVGKDEAADEPARGDAAVQVGPVAFDAVALTDHVELVVLDRDVELGGGEAGHRQGDPDPAVA